MVDFAEDIFGLFDLEENCDSYTPDFDIQKFLKENYDDTIILLNQANFQQLQRPLLVMFHHLKLKGNKFWIDKFYEVALKYPKTIQFAVAEFEDIVQFRCDCNELDYFGFGANFEPYVFAIDVNERQHQFDEPFTIDTLTSYCEKLRKNDIYRSDPIPIWQNSEQNVEIIVAHNFRQLVEENEKDVFVTLHSNYSFGNTYSKLYLKQLYSYLKDDRDSLAFYKINSQTNFVPLEYKALELPTSFLIPHNDKSKRLRYVHKDHEFSEIRRFIAKNTSKELKVLDRNGNDKRPKSNHNDNIEETMDEGQKKLINVLKNLTTIIEKKLPNEQGDNDNGFLRFLGTILNKVDDELDRDYIKTELITLATKRVREVLTARAERLYLK